MDAAQVISIFRDRGFTLSVTAAGNLKAQGPRPLTEKEGATLKEFKASILRLLALPPIKSTATSSGEPVTANLAAIEPEERECRNCARFEPYPFEPILGSCYALKRMQHATSKPARFGCGNFE
ncbi:MAG TPA: hypothetical protein VHP11_11270, partial [Tepidisphaeraceae bacterium]|nr:hypothetical protein [Tepidisphaeraceae bacterium]